MTLTKIEKKIYELAEQRAKNFYKHHRKILKECSMDLEDIIQECCVIAVKTLKRYKGLNLLDIKKLLNRTITWKLQEQLSRKWRPEHYTFVDSGPELELLQQFAIKNNHYFNFEQLLSICDEKEYQILCWKFKEGKTYAEIGKELGCSKQWAEKIYKDILKKLKKRFKEVLR